MGAYLFMDRWRWSTANRPMQGGADRHIHRRDGRLSTRFSARASESQPKYSIRARVRTAGPYRRFRPARARTKTARAGPKRTALLHNPSLNYQTRISSNTATPSRTLRGRAQVGSCSDNSDYANCRTQVHIHAARHDPIPYIHLSFVRARASARRPCFASGLGGACKVQVRTRLCQASGKTRKAGLPGAPSAGPITTRGASSGRTKNQSTQQAGEVAERASPKPSHTTHTHTPHPQKADHTPAPLKRAHQYPRVWSAPRAPTGASLQHSSPNQRQRTSARGISAHTAQPCPLGGSRRACWPWSALRFARAARPSSAPPPPPSRVLSAVSSHPHLLSSFASLTADLTPPSPKNLRSFKQEFFRPIGGPRSPRRLSPTRQAVRRVTLRLMAKVTFGPTVSEARGKIGDTSYGRSRAGPTARRCPIWTDPNTSYQQTVRTTYMKAVHIAWGATLTQLQRDAWTDLANQHANRDRFNQPFYLTGEQLFTQCSMNSLLANGSRIDTAPPRLSAPDCGTIAASASASAGTLTITPQVPMPSGHGMILQATKPLSPGIANFNKYLRKLWGGANVLLTDNFPGGTFIPPWISDPVYPSTPWSEASNTLTWAGSGSPNTIYQGGPWGGFNLTVQVQQANFTNSHGGPCARVDGTTGARYQAYVAGGAMIYLTYQPLWGIDQPGHFAYANCAHPNDSNFHTWLWTFNGGIQNLYLDTVLKITCTNATLTAGGVGFQGNTLAQSFRALSVIGPGTTPPVLPNVGSSYLAKFTSMTAGKKIGILLQYVNLTTGAKSPAQSAHITIAA